MFARSIRFRILAWQAFLLMAVLSGFGVTAFQLHRTNELRRIDEELGTRVAAVIGDLRSRLPPVRGPFDGDPRGGQPGRPPYGFPSGEELSGEPERPGGPPAGSGDARLDGRGDPPPFERGGDSPDRGPGRGRGPRGPRGGWDDLLVDRPIRISDATLAQFSAAGDGAQPFHFVIWSRSGTVLRSSTAAAAGIPKPVPSAGTSGIHTRNRHTVREAYQFTGMGECILVGRSIAPDLERIRLFSWWLVAAGTGVLALGLGGGWVLAARALRPIDTISAAASRISAGRLSERIDTAGTDNELGRLARVLNSTFARLESAFDQQRQFTADASHELRTPIAVIVSEAQSALHRERGAADYRESLEICLEAAQQMRRLSESLLQLARFDAGQESIERNPIDLADPVREVAELVTPLAREKGIRFHADLQPAPVVGDAARLARVASNLLTNAIWYNRPGGELRATTRPAGGFAEFVVSDTGVGIPAGDLPHVFKRFYRADRSRGRAEGHHGLGLAIAKAVIDAHGGTIEVVSTPGEGTTFTVRIPTAPSGSANGTQVAAS